MVGKLGIFVSVIINNTLIGISVRGIRSCVCGVVIKILEPVKTNASLALKELKGKVLIEETSVVLGGNCPTSAGLVCKPRLIGTSIHTLCVPLGYYKGFTCPCLHIGKNLGLAFPSVIVVNGYYVAPITRNSHYCLINKALAHKSAPHILLIGRIFFKRIVNDLEISVVYHCAVFYTHFVCNVCKCRFCLSCFENKEGPRRCVGIGKSLIIGIKLKRTVKHIESPGKLVITHPSVNEGSIRITRNTLSYRLFGRRHEFGIEYGHYVINKHCTSAVTVGKVLL